MSDIPAKPGVKRKPLKLVNVAGNAGTDKTKAAEPKAAASLLIFEDVTVSFDDKIVLENLSLEVNAGEIVALTGPAGAGKSVALNCITGENEPTGGRVYYKGEIIASGAHGFISNIVRGMASHMNRRSITRIYSDVRLSGDLTVFECAHAAGRMRPDLLLIDGLTAGMDQCETIEFYEYIRQIKRQFNLTILLAERDINSVMKISDRIYKLNEN